MDAAGAGAIKNKTNNHSDIALYLNYVEVVRWVVKDSEIPWETLNSKK